jgi:hypothetical protein
LVREAAEGGIIVIERRGEPVAEPQVGDSTKILEEDRSR